MYRVVLFIALLLAPYVAYSQAEGFLPKGEFPKTDFANRSNHSSLPMRILKTGWVPMNRLLHLLMVRTRVPTRYRY